MSDDEYRWSVQLGFGKPFAIDQILKRPETEVDEGRNGDADRQRNSIRADLETARTQ